MNKRLIFFSALVVLQSCSVLNPVLVDELAENHFRMVTHANTFTSREFMQARLDSKAEEICSPNAVVLVADPEFQVLENRNYINGQWMDVSSFRLSQSIRCEEQS